MPTFPESQEENREGVREFIASVFNSKTAVDKLLTQLDDKASRSLMGFPSMEELQPQTIEYWTRDMGLELGPAQVIYNALLRRHADVRAHGGAATTVPAVVGIR